MNIATSPRYNDTIYVGPVMPNGAIDIAAIKAVPGVEGAYQPPLSSEWVVYCDPKRRAEVVKAIQNLGKEQMFLA